MKKGDIVIISALLVLSAASALLIFPHKKGNTVKVTQNGQTVYEGSLYENKELFLGTNTLEIKNGHIKMVSADCKNQICVNHKEISRSGESIICLPNKITAEIE